MTTRRPRSPRYPQLSLEESIERVRKVYQAERTYKVEKEAVAKDLGYGGLNGASIGLIGTLKNYGLLREDKEGVQVTEDAVTILRAPENDPEREEALRRAAFTPKVFAELNEAYGEDLSELPSDTTMQYRLEKRGFLEKAAGEVIRIYRDNLELVSKEELEYTAADEPVDEQQETQMQQATNRQVPASTDGGSVSPDSEPRQQDAAMPTTFLLQFRPTENSEARIELMGDLSQEAIETIRQVLNTIKGSPAKDQQPGQSETEPSVEQLTTGDGSDGPS